MRPEITEKSTENDIIKPSRTAGEVFLQPSRSGASEIIKAASFLKRGITFFIARKPNAILSGHPVTPPLAVCEVQSTMHRLLMSHKFRF